MVRLGIGLEIAGVLGLGLVISAHTAPWELVIPLFVYGAGMGLATAQLTGVVLADVPVSQSGQGSGTQSTACQVDSALGIAILGTILFSVLGGQLCGELAVSSGRLSAGRFSFARPGGQPLAGREPSSAQEPCLGSAANRADRAFPW